MLRLIGFCAALAPVSMAMSAPPGVPVHGGAGVLEGELEKITPDSVGFFVRVLEFGELYEEFSHRDALGAIGLVESTAAEGSKAPPNDWADMLRGSLGVEPRQIIKGLFGREVAIAAPAFENLDEGVALMRITERETLKQIFAVQKAAIVRRDGNTTVRRLESGLYVATNRSFCAIAQQDGDGSLFAATIELMKGRSAGSLGRLPSFKEQVGAIPAGARALLYVDPRRPEEQRSMRGILPPGWPEMKRLAVGMYVSGDGVTFSVSGVCAPGDPGGTIEPAGERADPILDLPLSTLAVFAGSIDWQNVSHFVSQSLPQGAGRLYLWVLQRVAGDQQAAAHFWQDLDPQAVVVWGRPPDGGARAPMFSVIAKSREAQAVHNRLVGLSAAAADMINGLARRPPGDPLVRVQEIQYRNYSIRQVDVGRLLTRQKVEGLWRDVSPAFACVGDSVIVSSRLEHLCQILDARDGLIGHLRAVDEFRSVRERAGDYHAILLLQPALAGREIAAWLEGLEATRPELRNSKSFAGPLNKPPPAPITLGVGLRNSPDVRGAVMVHKLFPGWPAAQQLRLGDLIIGCDEKLLSLDDAIADLKKHLQTARDTRRPRITLRVMRGDAPMEIPVDLPQPAPTPPRGVHPLAVLRGLCSVAEPFSKATYAVVHDDRPDRFAAELRLWFNEAPSRTVAAPGK